MVRDVNNSFIFAEHGVMNVNKFVLRMYKQKLIFSSITKNIF